jgi:nanoRNase/pAp phosphatase (c-di-AMP/oligoRNAs hydrolase)
MDIQTGLPKIKEQIEKAKTIVIATGNTPSMDSIGSTLSLYLGLIGIGKTVSVVCPTPMTVEFSSFVGANKLETAIGGKRNFVISLDYQEGSIEKVSYNIEGNKFNLVIEPRPGFEDFSEDKVQYTHFGGQADLIITVNTMKLDDLGPVYEENKEFFREKPIVNIDFQKENTLYGAINLIDANVSSMTELIAVVMSFCGVKLSEDIATNLLNALIDATDQFQSDRVNARTYEVASVCMKAGAKKFPKRTLESIPVIQQQPTQTTQPDQHSQTTQQGVIEENQPQKSQNEDWLKPKIFKNPNSNV